MGESSIRTQADRILKLNHDRVLSLHMMVATNLLSETGNTQVILGRVGRVLGVLELPGKARTPYNIPRTGLRCLVLFVELVQFQQFGRERCFTLINSCCM